MFDTMKIARKIRECRIAKNMTQMNLADAMGVSYQAVSNWERGNSMPDISKLEDLCNALDISVNELLGMETKAAAAVEKVMQEAPLSMEELAEVAPILPPQTVKEQAKQNTGEKKKWNVAALADIAPFLDDDILEELVEEMEVESLTLLTCLAPFLDEDMLDKLVRRAPKDDFDGIGAMAPFLSEDTLDYLVDQCEGKPEDWAFFDTLVPFLSDETLARLVRKYSADMDERMMQTLAAFLDEDAIDALAEQKIAAGKISSLSCLYPFMEDDTLRKVARALLESGAVEEVNQVAVFL